MQLSRQLDRVPEPARRVIRQEVRVVTQRLGAIRRPRDLRRLWKDAAFVAELADPLAPALDRILALVVKSTVPITPGFATMATTTGAVVGATAESALEIGAALGIEMPPAAAAIAGSAFGVGMTVQLVEFYLTASMMWTRLKKTGHPDVAALRRAVLFAYLGDNGASGGLTQVSMSRIAAALVKRAIPGFIPLAGIPLAGVAAHRTQKRAQAAVASEIAMIDAARTPDHREVVSSHKRLHRAMFKSRDGRTTRTRRG